MLLWIAVVLPSLILATDTNWQYQIYVSSSDGTNSSSCWNGSVPCNTLNLALQGVQHNSTVIYLYPGIYTLDDEVQVRNISRIAIIGLSNDVTISCQPLTGQWLDNIIFQCVTFYSCPITISNSIPCPFPNTTLYLYDYSCNNTIQPGGNIEFNAIVFDHFNSKRWTEGLKICIISGPDLAKMCSNKKECVSVEWTNDESFCNNNYYSYSICYYADSLETSTDLVIEIETMGSTVTAATNITLSLEPCDAYEFLDIKTGMCTYYYDCTNYDSIDIAPCCYFQYFDDSYNDYHCTTNRTGRLCGSCEDGYSVPINLPTKCVQCDPLIGWILFVTVQLLPVTVMVLLIIVFNIQLTSGSINALVFYSQLLTTVYPGFTSMFGNFCSHCPTDLYFSFIIGYNCYPALLLIPLNIFNIDFTLFLNDYPLCISSVTTPLAAISFWYVIGLYPLLLLLLLYVWITLYDKGYKVIVLITRPIHRLLARFWRMTNIEPSLPHSIASIYLLCFMQLAATSFKLLHFSIHDGKVSFFYDGTLNYFGWPHSFAGIFAILVLILLVLIPMLYIQLYPFKPFHKLLECLHLNNWQILTSLGDVFTGPYKNGTTNKLDYRYFAGFYLLLRIIILLLYFISTFGVYIFQICVFGLFSGAIMIFRPYQRDLNNFNEFIISLFLAVLSLLLLLFSLFAEAETLILIPFSFDCLVFGIIIPVYFIYWTVKKIRSCYGYCRDHRLLSSNTTYGAVNDTDQIDGIVNDSDWIADRMINPQDYDEQHVSVTPL